MLKDMLCRRTTIRRYRKEDVSDALIDELLDSAMRTQTMGNLQLYSVVRTRSEEMKQRLLPTHFGQPMVVDAPVVLTICADFHRTTRWCEEREAQPGYGNVLSLMNAMSDALLFTQTFSLLAEEAGLGLCYLGTTIYNPGQIIDVLGLPQLVMPVATLTVGWPDERPVISDRLPLSAIVHEETYHDYSRADIDRLYQPKEALPENREFVRVNGKQTLAQVFTDCRYRREDNEAMSETFLETMRRQGFMV